MSSKKGTAKPVPTDHDDEIYLRIWEKQQDLVTSRWTVLIFFMSISFALFGLSFQNQKSEDLANAQRLTGLFIYFFSYFLYLRYTSWSRFLRDYLKQMELSGSTKIRLGTTALTTKPWSGLRRLFAINKLLLYFGIIYLIAVIGLWLTEFSGTSSFGC